MKEQYVRLLYQPGNTLFSKRERHLRLYDERTGTYYILEADIPMELTVGNHIIVNDKCYLSWGEENPVGAKKLNVFLKTFKEIGKTEEDVVKEIVPKYVEELEDKLFLIVDENGDNYLYKFGKNFLVKPKKFYYVGAVRREDLSSNGFIFFNLFSNNENYQVESLTDCLKVFKVTFMAKNLVEVNGMINGKMATAYLLLI